MTEAISAMLKDMQRIVLREIAIYDETDREQRTDETITRIEALGSTPWAEAADDVLLLLAHEWQPLCAELCDVWDTPPEQLALTVKCALCLRAFNEERYQLAWRILYGIITGSGIHAARVESALNVKYHNIGKGQILTMQNAASVDPRRNAARAEAKRIWEADPALKLTDCARQVRNHLEETRPHNSKAPYRSVSERQVQNYIRDLCPSK